MENTKSTFEDYNVEGYYDVQWKMKEAAIRFFKKNNITLTKENLNNYFENVWSAIDSNGFEELAERAVEHVEFEKNSFSFEEIELNKEYLVVPIDGLNYKFHNSRGIVLQKNSDNHTVSIKMTTGLTKGTLLPSLSIDALQEIKEYEGFRVRDRIHIKSKGENTITDIDFENKVIRANSREIPFEEVLEKLRLLEVK